MEERVSLSWYYFCKRSYCFSTWDKHMSETFHCRITNEYSNYDAKRWDIFNNSFIWSLLCFYYSGRCGTKPVRLLMDQRTGRFLGALNQNELMGPPKADMSKKASPTSFRGTAQQKPRMSRPMKLWPGERPQIISPSMPSNINQVRRYFGTYTIAVISSWILHA